MLVARGHIENRQAIVKIGLQPFIPQTLGVQPYSQTIQIPVHGYRALIDTGALRTCLCRGVIGTEGLQHHGKKPIQNVHGIERHYLYWVNIGFFCESLETLADRVGTSTYFASPDPIEVIDIADNYWFDAIIGMDIISRCNLQIEKTGPFSLTLGG